MRDDDNNEEEEAPAGALPPISTWPIYSRIEVVRAFQTLVPVAIKIPIHPFQQYGQPGDYIIVGAANIMRIMPKAQFEKMYTSGEEVASPEKTLLLAR